MGESLVLAQPPDLPPAATSPDLLTSSATSRPDPTRSVCSCKFLTQPDPTRGSGWASRHRATLSTICLSYVVKVDYETLCPTWDESLIFDDIVVYGLRDELIRNPPVVTVEIYDYDIVVSHIAAS